MLFRSLATSATVSNAGVAAGGAAFYKLVVPAGGTVTLTLSGISGTVNQNLLVIVRTK